MVIIVIYERIRLRCDVLTVIVQPQKTFVSFDQKTFLLIHALTSVPNESLVTPEPTGLEPFDSRRVDAFRFPTASENREESANVDPGHELRVWHATGISAMNE